jgi:hypothetical protein
VEKHPAEYLVKLIAYQCQIINVPKKLFPSGKTLTYKPGCEQRYIK